MTENLPAVPDAPNLPAVTAQDTDSWVERMRPTIALAEQISGTEFVPKQLRNSVPAVTAAILYGREVGLPPMTSLTQTHVIEGKPSMSAEAMRAMVLAAGHELEFLETTGATCRMRGRRRGGSSWTEVVWTIDMARAAKVTGKDNWQKYPRAMLIARCTTDLCRMVFPDVIHGFRSVEEMQDVGLEDAGAAGGGPSTAASTTSVQRRGAKKAAAKKAVAAPAQAPAALPAGGPPLPGEDGYDAGQPAAQTPGGGAPGDGDASPEAPTSGEDGEGAPPSGTDAPGSVEAVSPPSPTDTDPGAPSPENAADDDSALPVRGDGASGEAPAEENDRRPITKAQQRMVMAQFNRFELAADTDRDERLAICSTILEREVESTSKITKGEAHQLIEALTRCQDRAAVYRLLDTIDQASAEKRRAEIGEQS